MSALLWERMDRKGKGLRLKNCDDVACNSAARWRLSILAYPAGNYCRKCEKRMTEAWNSALGSQEDHRDAA